MERIQAMQIRDNGVKQRLEDVSLIVSWREIAKTYFGKSSSWLYHKFDGIDGNGGSGGFTESEKEVLRGALCDIADRLRKAAEKI